MTFALLLLVLVMGSVSAALPQAKPDISWEEKLLGKIPDDVDVQNERPEFSPDGRSFGYSFFLGNKKYHVTVGAWRSEAYDSGGDFESQVPLFSPDGKSWAFRAVKGEKQFIVVNGKKGEDFDKVGGPVFSPDGRTVAYWAEIGDKRFMVVGDRRGPEFGVVGDPVFSPDGKTVAYEAREGVYPVMVVGDRRIRLKDGNPERPVWKPDSSLLAFVERGREQSFLWVGDQRTPTDSVSGLRFSPDGGTMVYRSLSDNRKWFVFVNGTKSEAYDDVERVDPFVFAPDGKTVTYRARIGNKWFTVSGATKGPEFDYVSMPVYQKDGRTLTYLVGEGPDEESLTYYFAPGGRKGPRLGVAGDLIFPMDAVYSPDGKAFACPLVILKDKKAYVLVGKQRGEPFDHIGRIVFSADGKKVAHGALKGRELWWKVRSVE